MISKLDSLCEAAFSRFFYALALCFIGGSLAALAMPPMNAWYILPLSFGVLYLGVLFAPNKRGAFLRGWVFGFGYFVFSLSWIGNALLVEGNAYKWAWPLAVCALPAGLALFTACSTLLTKAFADLKKTAGFFGFVGFFSLFEWLRGHLFTGFPWNLFGYTWSDWPAMMQGLFLSDTYMLSLLTILWASTFVFALLKKRESIIVLIVAGISFTSWFGYGALRLKNADTAVHENIQVKIIQPNIAQSEKWQRQKMAGHFAQMLELSKADEDNQNTTYIVWPETALSYWIANDSGAMGSIRAMLHSYPQGATLFTGMLRYEPDTKRYFNSLVSIGKDGQITNIYDKSHLVPFGEYIPFQQFIPLKPVVEFTGFKAGNGPEHFSTSEGLEYSPLVCYEVLFPHAVTASNSTPDFIVNVTNDGWYGDSAGPHQHLAITTYRAIESGVPVLRSANTGISAIISPFGTIMARGELFKTEKILSSLPLNQDNSPLSELYRIIMFFAVLLSFTANSFIKKRT